MGLINFLSKQFINILQWTEEEAGILAYRYPMQDMEIKSGAQLVVRETQRAIFINEGTLADEFGPGTYTLTTRTLPLLTDLKNWDKKFESPFKSDAYFFSTREQINQKWGTATPITVRDKDFGAIRIRSYGTYSFKIADIQQFYKTLSATSSFYTVDDISEQLRSAILTSLSTALGGSDVAFADMAANQELFSKKLTDAVGPALSHFGLELTSFYVQNLSLPEELQHYLDKAASMRMIGDTQKYTQFQAAESLPVAAANPGGMAGTAVGLGAGITMGQMMAGAMGNAMNNGSSNNASPAPMQEDPFVLIDKLGELLKKGYISQEEFDTKKAAILSRIA